VSCAEALRWTLTAKRLRPPAQGCRSGYPGITIENDCSTATRLRHLVIYFKYVATALRLESMIRFTQGSRSGNPGLYDTTALRLATKRMWTRLENLTHLQNDTGYK
jgi:hypothetical protein